MLAFGAAALLVAALLVLRAPRRAPMRPELAVIRWGAVAVLGAIAAEAALAHRLLPLAAVVEWWQYALAPMGAAAVLAAVGAVLARRPQTPEVPVAPSGRRGWASFLPRRGAAAAASAVLVLLLTIVGAGLASSPDDRGRWVDLVVAVPNSAVDPFRFHTFGWSCGVPVLLALVALLAAAQLVLRADALRPFRRPDTESLERTERRRLAGATVGLVVAATALAVGEAWRLIGGAGLIETVRVGDEALATGSGAGAIATWIGGLAAVPTIAGFALLLLLAIAPSGTTARAHDVEPVERAVVAP
ncbi:MAG: hypothetical protein GXX90_05090 [Microbacteriaceae bacterium]|nr:hypothetical protein [Microbacteriaceae bacterium]